MFMEREKQTNRAVNKYGLSASKNNILLNYNS